MRAAVLLSAVLGLVTLGACAKNVKQDAKTGEDGKWKGAKPVVLEAEGAARLVGESKGIVTYPGGDRVDWRMVELPADKRGTLELELSWTAPRPGLDLSFDVYNEWGRKLDSAKPKRQKKAKGRKKVSLASAKGKLYVEVYASNRGDAGKYKLDVRFDEAVVVVDTSIPWDKLQVPDPPKLAAIPPTCTSIDYDPANPDCVKNPPACTPTTYNAKNPKCAAVCPSPPDPALAACKAPEGGAGGAGGAGGGGDDGEGGTGGGTVVTEAKGKIMDVTVSGDLTTITIDVGANHPVERGWTGQILDDRNKPMKGGDFVVRTTRSRQVTATVKLKSETVTGKKVILHAP